MSTTQVERQVPVRVIDLHEEARLAALRDLRIAPAPEPRFDRLTRLAQRLFDVPVALVTLLDRDRQLIKSYAGAASGDTAPSWVETGLPRPQSFCNTTITLPDGLVVEDLAADRRFAGHPLVTGEPGVRFYAGETLRAPGGEAIGTFCLLGDRPRTLTTAERETLRDLASYVQRELRLGEEFSQAADVQRRLLPRRMPELPGWDVAGACLPARAVGGDLFDLHPAPGGLALTVADVMGKGFAAAIIMASVRAALRAAAQQTGPAETLTSAARVLEHDLEETGRFVTVFHARLCPDDGHLDYVDAGHGLTLVVRADGGTERVGSAGLPVGAWPDSRWEQQSLDLAPGDRLVVVSDGVLDLFDVDPAVDRLADLVQDTDGAQQLVDRVVARARCGEMEDDVTVLVARRLPLAADRAGTAEGGGER